MFPLSQILGLNLPDEYMMCYWFEGFIDSLILIVTRIDPSVIARLALPHVSSVPNPWIINRGWDPLVLPVPVSFDRI